MLNLLKDNAFLKGKGFFCSGAEMKEKPLKEKNTFERKNLFERPESEKGFFWRPADVIARIFQGYVPENNDFPGRLFRKTQKSRTCPEFLRNLIGMIGFHLAIPRI